MKKLFSLLFVSFILMYFLPVTVLGAPTNEELQQYLVEIDLTEEELVEYLSYDDLLIEDFETIEELREYIGEILTEENLQLLLDEYELTIEELEALLVEYGDIEQGETVFDGFYFYNDLDFAVFYYLDNSSTPIDEENLQELLEKYSLTYDELVALFEENDDSIENYEYIEDLDLMVDYYLNYGGIGFDSLFTEIGLTEEEVETLFSHLMTLNIEDPAYEEKLVELSTRMEAIGEFESAKDLTAEQIAELLSIFTELLDLFELDAKFSFVKNNEKTAVSLEALIQLDSTNGYDLLIELNNKQGAFLADVLLTAEMFGSEIIEEVGKDLKETEEIVKEMPKVEKTVKGGKLPNTASDYPLNTLLGLGIMAVGIVLFRRWKKNYAA